MLRVILATMFLLPIICTFAYGHGENEDWDEDEDGTEKSLELEMKSDLLLVQI